MKTTIVQSTGKGFKFKIVAPKEKTIYFELTAEEVEELKLAVTYAIYSQRKRKDLQNTLLSIEQKIDYLQNTNFEDILNPERTLPTGASKIIKTFQSKLNKL